MLEKKRFNNIVVFRTDRIGEVLISSTAASALKNRYPEARVSFVTSGYSRPVLECNDEIDKVFTVDTLTRKGWLGRSVRLAIFLRKKGFDAAVVLNPHKMLHLAIFLAGIRIRVGYARKWGFLLTNKYPDSRDEGMKHESEYLMDLLGAMDIYGPPPQMCIRSSENARMSVSEKLSGKGVSSEERLIAIHLGSSNPSKIWPVGNYSELIKRIMSENKENRWRVVLLGSAEERDIVGRVKSGVGKGVTDMSGEFDLPELIALIERSDLFIGNDSGPMHIAAAADVPVIAIFGRNIRGVGPLRWGPRGDGHVVFHKDPGCDPCYDDKCPYDRKCLRAITVDMVFKAFTDKLRD